MFVFFVWGSSGLRDVTSRSVDREGPPGERHSANPHYLNAFATLRKATISFVVSVRPHSTRRLPLDGFSWTSMFKYVSKICRENSRFIKIEQNDVYFTRRLRYIMIMFRSVLLRMRNVSDKSCGEDQNTRSKFNNFFLANGAVYEKVWKNTVLPGRPHVTGNMSQSLCVLDT